MRVLAIVFDREHAARVPAKCTPNSDHSRAVQATSLRPIESISETDARYGAIDGKTGRELTPILARRSYARSLYLTASIAQHLQFGNASDAQTELALPQRDTAPKIHRRVIHGEIEPSEVEITECDLVRNLDLGSMSGSQSQGLRRNTGIGKARRGSGGPCFRNPGSRDREIVELRPTPLAPDSTDRPR